MANNGSRAPPWSRKVQEWCRRYLPAELAGTAGALIGAFLCFQVTGQEAAAAIAGSLAESAGFYATIAIREWRRGRQRVTTAELGLTWFQRALARLNLMARIVIAMAAEFGGAELLDSLLVRPFAMYAGPRLTGDLTSGTLLGKIAADAIFYACAIVSFEILRTENELSPARTDRVVADRPPVPEETDSPALVMDLDRVAAAYHDLTETLPGVALHYAVKCNSYRPVLTTLHALGCGFEIASATEIAELLAVGSDPAAVLFSNPVKPEGHIARAYAHGTRIFAFDSAEELAKLAAAAPGARVLVRLATSQASSDVPSEGKFGVDRHTAARLLLEAREFGLQPFGVAFHVGSQMMSPAAWRAPLSAVGELLAELAAQRLRLELVDVGGGFPARYGGCPPPLGDYGAVIAEGLAALPYPVRAVAEPGRALVAEAGTLVATVIGTANRGGRRWIHLDVGAFNGLMECLETGNRLRYPVRDSLGSAKRQLCHLTGPTCDSQDSILFDVELSAELSAGDRVFFGTAGAYTTVYASTFNGFCPPVVRDTGPARTG